jgi:hypothetical protein
VQKYRGICVIWVNDRGEIVKWQLKSGFYSEPGTEMESLGSLGV